MKIHEIIIEHGEPVVGDIVQMECGDTLVETTIAEVTSDGVVLHLDETGLRILVNGARQLQEGKTGPGLWANIHARRKSGKRMRKKGDKGAPTEKALKAAQAGSKNESVEDVAEAWGAGLGGGEPLFKQKPIAPTRSVMKLEKLLQDFNPEAYSKIVVSFTESTPIELIQKYFRSLGSSLKIQTVNYRDYDPKQIEVTDPSLYEPVLQIYLKFLKDTGQDTIFNSVYMAPAKGSQKVDEAKYQGREVPLGKPMAGDVAKSKVYVKNAKGNVVKVNFGQKGVKIKKNNPGRRKNFRARHNCDNPGPRTSARYWSCKAW